jgi:2-dehydro-3-deoxygalactonokinase
MVSAVGGVSASFIGVDWGSTNVRAMLMGDHGKVLSTRVSAAGASTLPAGPCSFGAALVELLDDWQAGDLPILCCGMVGCKHGWSEAPYVDCPGGLRALAHLVRWVDWNGRNVGLVPGLRFYSASGVPDVLRGEETQVLGAVELNPRLQRSCIVMPGTHSKWADVVDGSVRAFATHMTGELFAVLREHSVLGRLMGSKLEFDTSAFGAGVSAARDAGSLGLQHQLFAVRSLGVEGRMAPGSLSDYMSGLLIGHEVGAGRTWQRAAKNSTDHVVLIGEGPLVDRYRRAFEVFDVGSVETLPNTAATGLWTLAQHIGCLKE